MYAFIEPFVKLLIFRAGPQDIPPSQPLFKFTLIGCFLTDILGAAKTLGIGLASFLSAGQIALLGGCIYLLLKLNNKTERWLQTLAAVFGTLTLINLATFPFIDNLQIYQENQIMLSPGLLLVGVLQIWFFVTMARILRDALETRMGRAALYTFLIVTLVPIVLTIIVNSLGIEVGPANAIETDQL